MELVQWHKLHGKPQSLARTQWGTGSGGGQRESEIRSPHGPSSPGDRRTESGDTECRRHLKSKVPRQKKGSGAQHTTFMYCAPPIHTTLHPQNLSTYPLREDATRVRSSVRRHSRTVLPNRSGVTACALPGTGDGTNSVASTALRLENTLVSPFVVVCVRHHPLTLERVPTALQGTSPGRNIGFRRCCHPLLLRPHSPSTAFESPRRPVWAPVTSRPPQRLLR